MIYPMTEEGEKALRQELAKLKNIERPKISKAIAEAREFGDLKENAEYHAAREQQSFLETRINEIEGKLSNSVVINIANIEKNHKVVFGVTVALINLENDQAVEYKIVGDDEADLKNNKISINSPIARALIGKMEGDTAVVETPKGEVEYEITEVKYIQNNNRQHG